MMTEIDASQAEKKLSQPWSASAFSRGLSENLLVRVCSAFEGMEKKAKLRLLISLLGVSSKQLPQLAGPMKLLLDKAAESESGADKSSEDSWISIISAFVKHYLFGGNGQDIQTNAEQMDMSAMDIIHKMELYLKEFQGDADKKWAQVSGQTLPAEFLYYDYAMSGMRELIWNTERAVVTKEEPDFMGTKKNVGELQFVKKRPRVIVDDDDEEEANF